MQSAEMNGPWVRVRIYFGERDKHEGRQMADALLEVLRGEGASGATITRGVAGFGAHSKIHRASIVDISPDLPLVLEWIDSESLVRRVLPVIERMMHGGLITTDPVTVVWYQPHEDRAGDPA